MILVYLVEGIVSLQKVFVGLKKEQHSTTQFEFNAVRLSRRIISPN